MEPIAVEEPGQEVVNAYAFDIQIKNIMNMTVIWTISIEIFKIAFDYVNQLNKIEFFQMCVCINTVNLLVTLDLVILDCKMSLNVMIVVTV